MKKQEKAIKEIIQKYGDTIDLKRSPYLIAEIVRNYASYFDLAGQHSEPVPGSHGTPPPPPPGPSSNPFTQMYDDILNQLGKFSLELKAMNKKLDGLMVKSAVKNTTVKSAVKNAALKKLKK